MATASKFALAMKKKATVWKKAAKAAPRSGGKFGPANVPDGQYEAIISAECGITEPKKKGAIPTPYVRLKATISDGDFAGLEPQNFHYLDGKMPSDAEDAMPTNEEKLAGDLKQILPDLDIEETLSSSPEKIEAIIAEINTRGQKMRIGVSNRIGKEGSKSAGKRFQDVYFNELLEGGSPTNGQVHEEEAEAESDEEEVVEESEDEEEVVEEEDASDDGSAAPGVGDTVLYRPKGGRKDLEFEVTSVNNGKETVGIKGNGKKYSGVPWSSLK